MFHPSSLGHRWAALHRAAQEGLDGLVRELLNMGYNASAKDPSGRTALHVAAICGHSAVVKVLLEKGANVSARNDTGFTAMAFAVPQGHKEVVRELLKYVGPDEDVVKGATALQLAAMNGQEEVACLLLENGASVDAKDRYGWTALHRAARAGHVSVMRILLENGANISVKTLHGSTPLHAATENGKRDAALLLIEKGADIAARDNEGMTALHRTADGTGDEAVGLLLLEKGADISARDNATASALHRAVGRGSEGIARLLIEHGANTALLDSSGFTPLDVATSVGGENVVRLLLEKGAELGSTDDIENNYGALDSPEWPELDKSAAAGMTNPEGMAHVRLGKLLDAGSLNLPPDNPSEEQQRALLCLICANLKLTALDFLPRPFEESGASREEHRKLFDRSFSDIQKETLCPLCGLIRHAVESSGCAPGLEPDNLHCNVYMVRFSGFWDHENGHESFRFLTVKGSIPGRSGSLFSADLVPVESPQFPLCFVGRIVDEQISPLMIQRWLRQCEVIHDKRCFRLETPGNRLETAPLWNHHRFEALLPSLYFIDVHQNCLTRLQTLDRYVALSYVWGDCQSLRACRSNINDLEKPGSLTLLQNRLPAVIKDAIFLTAKIDERYLWIDRLCIVQDDHANKHTAISNMNLIYGNAILTIIAATSSDANVGLAGIGTCPRSQKQEPAIIAPHLKLIVPHSLKALDRTIWATRAWTFQEYFLSPRRLVFLNGQVCFKCSWDAPSREDILSEYQIFGMEDYTYKLPSSNLVEASMFKSSGQLSQVCLLPALIQEYSSRQLSYQNDILDAIAGFADMISNECGFRLCYGLTQSTLTYAMFWKARIPFLTRRAGFPSWSWCGWIGGVITQDKIRDVAKWTGRFSWIHWYLFDNEKKKFRLLFQQDRLLGVSKHDGDDDLTEFFRSMAVKATAGIPTPDVKILLRSDSPVSSTFRSRDWSMTCTLPSTGTGETMPIGVGPQYLEFLQKHNQRDLDPAYEASPSSTRSRQSIPSTHGINLTSFTLYFRTLMKIVHISAYDPKAHTRAHVEQNANVYDLSGQFLGVAWVNHLMFLAFGIYNTATGSGTKPTPDRFPDRFPIHMAVMSGPAPAVLGSDKSPWASESQGHGTGHAAGSLKFYQVMFLTQRRPPTYDTDQGTYERAGIGEVPADTMDCLTGLEWTDIILQ